MLTGLSDAGSISRVIIAEARGIVPEAEGAVSSESDYAPGIPSIDVVSAPSDPPSVGEDSVVAVALGSIATVAVGFSVGVGSVGVSVGSGVAVRVRVALGTVAVAVGSPVSAALMDRVDVLGTTPTVTVAEAPLLAPRAWIT